MRGTAQLKEKKLIEKHGHALCMSDISRREAMHFYCIGFMEGKTITKALVENGKYNGPITSKTKSYLVKLNYSDF